MIPDADVVIVGVGLAGASAAAVLGRAGLRVVAFDLKDQCAPTFKAEKIEPDQADAFRRLGLMDGVRPATARISEIAEAHKGRVLRSMPIEQYGVFYQDMVNAVRRQIPQSVSVRVGRVQSVEPGPDVQVVRLDSGESFAARLVVLANGTGGRLYNELGFSRRIVRAHHSLCTGCDVARTDAEPFSFESLTYWTDVIASRVDYATFFPVPGRMRVNIFSYREPTDPWVHEMAADPWSTIIQAMPRLARVTDVWHATSKVENRPIDLYVTESAPRDGVVLLGDAFQSVCPATGTGVSKVLTDVECLSSHVGAWLSTPGMGAAKVASFYNDPAKVRCDRTSLEGAEHRRKFATDRSLRWSIHRRRAYTTIALDGFRKRQ